MGRPSNIVVVNADYRKIAQTFYQYQKRLGYVPNSYQARFNYLNEFLSWLECKGNTDLTSVTAQEVNQYYQYIKVPLPQRNHQRKECSYPRGNKTTV